MQSVNDGWLTMASGFKTEKYQDGAGSGSSVDIVDPNVAKAMIDLIDHPQI